MKKHGHSDSVVTRIPVSRRVTSQRDDTQLYRALVESAPDGIMVLDEQGTIILSNPTVERMFGYNRKEMHDLSVEDLMPERLRERHTWQRNRYHSDPRSRPMGTDLNLIALRKDGSEFPVEIMLSPLRIEDETLVISIVRDVELKKKQDEKVKTLSGLLPICAWCKKIRDDKGYWTKVEEYIAEHSNADFTHGICPDCRAAHFPKPAGPEV